MNTVWAESEIVRCFRKIAKSDYYFCHKWCRQPTWCNINDLLLIPIGWTCFGRWFSPSSGALDCVCSLWYNIPTVLSSGSLEAEEPLFLHLVGCIYYLYQRCTVKQISNLVLSCLSICPREATRLTLDGFSWNLIFTYFSKGYRGNSSFIKIGHE